MSSQLVTSSSEVISRIFTPPQSGECIVSEITGNAYTIGDAIGQGAFGDVYDCTDAWGESRAVKIIKPRNLPYEVIRQETLDELQRALALRHPNITYVYEAFEYRDTFYIVFERCHTSINDLMKIDNFAGHVWLRPIAKCVLQAVHYMHTEGFAHRDIHGGNVLTKWVACEMSTKEPSAITFKVADLGIAKAVGLMTHQATVLADWMRPPEAVDGQEFGPMDHRMDIYHCGLLFLQVLLGRPLNFTREEILSGAPRELALQLPAPFSTALEKALRRHVVHRTTSAMGVWLDLRIL